MKIIIITSAFIFLSIIACRNSQRQDNIDETPKALQENKSAVGLVSKSRYGDMVEDLYSEFADKTPELKNIEIKIIDLNESRDDSTETFDKYNNKSEAYYNSLNAHIEQIKDSALKERMKFLITNSLANYNNNISSYSKLLAEINSASAILSDLHTILKITRTLPLITKYQTGNKPSISSLEGYNKEIDNTIKLTDRLVEK